MITRLTALTAAMTALVPAVRAQPDKGIGVDERRGAQVPPDIALRRPGGAQVRIGDYFDGERPVILVLAYVRCPMLCNLVLRGLARTISELDRDPGQDYRVITVSLDPGEKASEAVAKQRELVGLIGHSGETWRWTYLLGHQPEIARLAAALGFRYRWDERTEQFAHPAVIFVLDPDGVISSALVGPEPGPAELGAALDVAAAGETGAALGGAVLNCFLFDPALRRYRDQIQIYFRIGAGLVLLAIVATVGGLLWREIRRRRR